MRQYANLPMRQYANAPTPQRANAPTSNNPTAVPLKGLIKYTIFAVDFFGRKTKK
jgi:hypothetical protein